MKDDELLATHDLSKQTASCNRCGFSYGVIISERISCGKAPKPLRSKELEPPKDVRGRLPRIPNLRPSGADDRYGYLRLVVHPKVRNKAIDRAQRQKISLSELTRRALASYLENESFGLWSEDDVRAAIKNAATKWTRTPVELEGAMLVFGVTPQMVDDLVAELYRGGKKVGR